jgi:hypothetical protein
MASPTLPAGRSRHAAAMRLLIACLRMERQADASGLERLVGRAGSEAILAAAAEHRVSGQVYARLRELDDAPAALIDGLGAAYNDSLRHHLRMLFELRRLSAALDATGVAWAVIKGPVVAELLYDDPAYRSYSDIDVLVDPAGFGPILDALSAHGARLLDRNWAVIRHEMRGELHHALPDGALLDLHWNLVNMYRGKIRLDAREVLSRRRRVTLGGLTVPALDPTDALIHLCVHGTLAGGDRLLWMSDVAQAAARHEDWDGLRRRASAWHVSRPVGYMLWRASSVLHAPIPPGLAEGLIGRQYLRLMEIADGVSPWHRPRRSLVTPGLMMTRSMGYGLAGAARWLVERTVRGLDPREPGASDQFTPRGSNEDFEAFVDAVMRADRRDAA